MKKQQGMSLISTMFWAVIIVLVVVLGIKLIPVYNEYFAAKSDLNRIVSEVDVGSTDAMYRSSFNKFAQIDDIVSIKSEDLVIERGNNSVRISADYLREVKLFGNVSLLFRFHVASSSGAR